MYLSARFDTTFVMNDYEAAIGIADRIVATYTLRNMTLMERNTMLLISVLLVSRLWLSLRPDYLVDAVHCIRTLVPCLPGKDCTKLAKTLDSLTQQCFKYASTLVSLVTQMEYQPLELVPISVHSVSPLL